MAQPYQLIPAQFPGAPEMIYRVETREFIPMDGGNRDYQLFLLWQNEGNTPDPYTPETTA